MPERDDELSAALRDYYQRTAQQPAPDVMGRVMMATDRRTVRIRRWTAIGSGALAAAIVGAVVAVAFVNHDQGHQVAPGARITPTPTATSSPSVTPSMPNSPPAPVGLPVMGFVPTDVTAISASEWWVLGFDGPACSSELCTRIVHTTDGGSHFASIPVPPVGPAQNGQQALRLRFADAAAGWLVDASGKVWATHDGGGHWASDANSRPITDLEASGGSVFAIGCLNASCSIERSSTARDSWVVLPASQGTGQLSHLNVNGVHVWAAIGAAGNGVGAGSLLTSSDGGQSFHRYAVCQPDLGFADVYAVDSSVLWVTCPTGTQAAVYRSTDGGQHFTNIGHPPIPNNASIGGVSSTIAVIGSAQTLLRTADGGHTFATVENTQSEWTVVGFTTPLSGFAVDLGGAGQSRLWRTDDSGAHWRQVTFP